MLQLPELAWLTFDHQLETLIVVDPSLGPRMEPTLWPSAICSIASGEFRARRGFVHVVATISFRISACSIDTPPLMPERIYNWTNIKFIIFIIERIDCGVLRINNEIRRWILSNLYCFNWLGNLLYSQNVFRFDWIVDRFGILLRILLSLVALKFYMCIKCWKL